MKEGFEIYIISGGHAQDIQTYLNEFSIPYSSIWSIVDFYDHQGKVTYFSDGSFHIETNLWNKAKADFCLKNKISMHIDDSSLYGQYFTTPFCLYNDRGNFCMSNQQKIDFTKTPTDVLHEILNAIAYTYIP